VHEATIRPTGLVVPLSMTLLLFLGGLAVTVGFLGVAPAQGAGGVAEPLARHQLTVTVSPNPEDAVGEVELHAVVQVSGPSFAGQTVTIESRQLQAICLDFAFETLQGGSVAAPISGSPLSVVLDSVGNAAVSVSGIECAPGNWTIDATLMSTPAISASTTLALDPPYATPSGLYGSPDTEVATGGGDVYAVFTIETNGQREGDVEIESASLTTGCTGGWRWEPGDGGTAISGVGAGSPAQTGLDAQGNAVFIFEGSSCGDSNYVVTGDLLSSPMLTFDTTFTVTGEAPTITKIEPSKGKPGRRVNIRGTYLSDATEVSFDGTGAVIDTDTPTEITTTVPAGATTGAIEVVTPGGTATSTKTFKVT
jgi:hypothetical protein